MTREEAITNLNMIRVAFGVPVTKEQRELVDDTFEMAIQALSQEPCEDVVSRQAVIKLFNGNIGSESALILHKVKQLPSVTQKSGKWIPVSERLPEEYGEYLITWKNSKYPKPYIGICECEITDVYDHEHNRFEVEWLFDGYITTAYPDSYVIAWMPLPKPYEPQESEDTDV